MKTAYRTNAAIADYATRKNRRLDHVLYVAPLRRLLLLVAADAPCTCVMLIAARADGDWHYALAGGAIYVFVTLLSSFGLIGVVEDKEVSPRATVLAIAYGPLAIVMMLVHWVLYGRFIPDFWKEPKKP